MPQSPASAGHSHLSRLQWRVYSRSTRAKAAPLPPAAGRQWRALPAFSQYPPAWPPHPPPAGPQTQAPDLLLPSLKCRNPDTVGRHRSLALPRALSGSSRGAQRAEFPPCSQG